MGKFCMCGRETCPICLGHRPSGLDELNLLVKGQLPPGGIPRRKRETRTVRHNKPAEFIPEIIDKPYFREGLKAVAAVMGVDIDAPREPCGECGRPYCPECGEPIPVRGDYCKPACRTKAWRRKKTE